MSLEILNQLEEKIKQAVETIQLLQLEVEELKEKNAESHRNIESLQTENEQLKTNTATGKNIFVHCLANSITFNRNKRLRKSKPFYFNHFKNILLLFPVLGNKNKYRIIKCTFAFSLAVL